MSIEELNKRLVLIISGSLLTREGETITPRLADERARSAVQAMQLELEAFKEKRKIMNDTKRWWISWYEQGDDPRPEKWPLPDSIHYWVSGETDDAFTLCAVVDALTEEEAKKAIINSGWYPKEWRFTEEKPFDWKPGSRFPWR